MAKFTETKDPEIEALENEVAGLPMKQEAEMGVSKILDEQVPDFFKKYARGRGMESIPAEACTRPRLKLTQKSSTHLGEADTKLGDWYLPSIKENFGPKLSFIPLFCDTYGLLLDPSDTRQVLARTKWLRDPATGEKLRQVWDPTETKFTVMLPKPVNKQEIWDTGKSVGASRLLTWGSREKGNPRGMAGTKFIRVYAWLLDHPKISPVEIAFGRSSYPVGSDLMSQLKMSKLPVFGNRYILGSKEIVEPGRSYLVYTVEADGVVKDEAFVEKLAEIEEGLKGMQLDVVIDEEDLSDPEPSSASDVGPNADKDWARD